jgi:transaldolase
LEEKKMPEQGYFHRVHAKTPTRFWINNPTLEQAKKAIEAGAVGCTTNPSYVSKLFHSEEDFAWVARIIDLLVPYEGNDSILASKVQSAMVSRISELFMPMYRASEGKSGFVTIQGDPFAEENAERILAEGFENRKIGENIIVKVPVTVPGISAIGQLVEKNIPTMATEVMSLAQTVSICEAYLDASKISGKAPLFYVTHITGILDDHFRKTAAERKLDISPEALKYAGLSIAKREYALLSERHYPGIMIGGGARKLEDFTELVGGNLAITINWEGTADTLLAMDGPVVSRIGADVELRLVDELKEKLPDYSRAYDVEGMKPDEYYDYGGVELFRNSFMKGWRQLVDLIAERRRMR